MRVGDIVDVYIPVGDEPYLHEKRRVIELLPEGSVLLDDNSIVHQSFLTVVNL